MSACAIKHWGTGTPCIKTDSPAAKEMAAKLAQMQAERDKQDGMWHGDSASERVMYTATTDGGGAIANSLIKRVMCTSPAKKDQSQASSSSGRGPHASS